MATRPTSELGLREARRDRDRVEEAEPHRPARLGMVARRPSEREAADAGGLDRRSRGEEGCLEGRRGADRVGVELSRRGAHPVEERPGMAAQDVGLGGRRALAEREPLVQRLDPCLRLRVPPGGMKAGEVGVADDLHQARSAMRRESAPSPSSRAAASARPQSGGVSRSSGSGASASIVAIRR